MEMNSIILATVSLGGMGLLFGAGLAFASQKFAVEVDPRAVSVREALPGANCGACGFPGCDAFANAVVSGAAPINGCPVGGQETLGKLSVIMGVEASSGDKQVARVLCQGGEHCLDRFEYDGIESCKAEHAIGGGGSKACVFGCLGGGDCVAVCNFDAIHINEYGVAQVEPDKCTACGLCVTACPKNLIEMVPYKQQVFVDCINTEIGGHVKKNCSNACIACKICEKNCPEDAIHVVDNIARIDYEKCTNCAICFEKCPTKAISFDRETEKLVVNG